MVKTTKQLINLALSDKKEREKLLNLFSLFIYLLNNMYLFGRILKNPGGRGCTFSWNISLPEWTETNVCLW